MIKDKDIEAGSYRQLITVYQIASRSTDSAGDKIVWDNDAGKKIWAHVKPLSARKAFEFGQTFWQGSYEIEIRYNRSLNVLEGNTLILYSGNYYIVASVIDEDNQHRKLTFVANSHKI